MHIRSAARAAREVQIDDDFILFALARQRDPDGTKLRRALHAHIACCEARSAREGLLRVVVATSVLLWLVAWWPTSLPGRARTIALASWEIGFGALVLAFLVEWYCRRLRTRHIQELAPSILQGESCELSR